MYVARLQRVPPLICVVRPQLNTLIQQSLLQDYSPERTLTDIIFLGFCERKRFGVGILTLTNIFQDCFHNS